MGQFSKHCLCLTRIIALPDKLTDLINKRSNLPGVQ